LWRFSAHRGNLCRNHGSLPRLASRRTRRNDPSRQRPYNRIECNELIRINQEPPAGCSGAMHPQFTRRVCTLEGKSGNTTALLPKRSHGFTPCSRRRW
jgi:hypothetical protein